MKKTTTICFRVPDEDKKKFQKLYPYSLSRFLYKCILCAIQDNQFFMKIFFKEI